MHAIMLTLPLAVFSSAAVAPAPAEIEWQHSLADSLARAARDQRPIVVCLNRAGERVSDRLLQEQYQDERIVGLLRETVNLFASDGEHARPDGTCRRVQGPTCAEHRAALEALTKHLARIVPVKGGGRKGKPGKPRRGSKRAAAIVQPPATPQHIFLDDRGTLLFSVPYGLTPSELEWCLLEAIHRVAPGSELAPAEQTHAPRRLRERAVTPTPKQAVDPPPDAEQVEQVLKRLRRTSRGDWGRESKADLATLVLSEDPQAVGYVRSRLSRRNSNRRRHFKPTELIHLIGRTAPRSWWSTVAPFVDDYRAAVRIEAAVALEQLGHPGAYEALSKQLRKEDDPAAEGAQLRALASVAPARAGVLKLISRRALKSKQQSLRMDALLAAEHLEQRSGVAKLASAALSDESGAVRALAAWLIGVRRADELGQALTLARESETDTQAQHAMDLALAALARKPGTSLEGLVRGRGDGQIKRDRR